MPLASIVSYGAAWCGMAWWYSVVMVWYDMVYGVVWCGDVVVMLWYGMVCMVWCGVVWHGIMAWYVWCGMLW